MWSGGGGGGGVRLPPRRRRSRARRWERRARKGYASTPPRACHAHGGEPHGSCLLGGPMHGPVLRLAGGRGRRVRPRGELVNPRRVTSDGDVASPTTPPQSSTPLRCANDNDRKLPATRFFRFLHNSLLLFYLLPFIEAAGSIYLQINKWW
jgi:hypothetical protein